MILISIVDVEYSVRAGWNPRDLAAAFLDGGAPHLQLRGKRLASGELLDLSDAIVRAAEPYGAAVVVNDRVDITRMSGAAGVHVGQDDLPPREARRMLGPDAIIGYSTHDVAQMTAAASEPVTYIAIGPVFRTTTKDTGYHPVGLDLVATAAQIAGDRPVVAIGGITLRTAPSVLARGAAGVAVIGDLLEGGNPRARVAAYLAALAQ